VAPCFTFSLIPSHLHQIGSTSTNPQAGCFSCRGPKSSRCLSPKSEIPQISSSAPINSNRGRYAVDSASPHFKPNRVIPLRGAEKIPPSWSTDRKAGVRRARRGRFRSRRRGEARQGGGTGWWRPARASWYYSESISWPPALWLFPPPPSVVPTCAPDRAAVPSGRRC
jgi:hypothetical protein